MDPKRTPLAGVLFFLSDLPIVPMAPFCFRPFSFLLQRRRCFSPALLVAADRLIHTAAPLFLAPLLYHLIEQTAEHAVKLRLTLLLFLPHHSVRQLFCFPLGQKIDNHLRHFVRFSEDAEKRYSTAL